MQNEKTAELNLQKKIYEKREYITKDCTMAISDAYIWAMIICFVIFIPYRFIYQHFWSGEVAFTDIIHVKALFKSIESSFTKVIGLLLSLLVIGCLVFAHELAHAIGFLPGCGWRWKGNIKIGIMLNKKIPIPYCVCTKDKIKSSSYFFAGVLPFLLLGILPYVIAVTTGNSALYWGSAVSIYGSSVDLLFLISLIRNRPQFVADVPGRWGYLGLYKK